MSKGSREQRTLDYFREAPDLQLARAVLTTATEILHGREREAGTRKPQQARKPRKSRIPTNSAMKIAGEQADQQPPF